MNLLLANVEVWSFEAKQYYDDLNGAVSHFMETYQIASNREKDLREYLKQTLVMEKTKDTQSP